MTLWRAAAAALALLLPLALSILGGCAAIGNALQQNVPAQRADGTDAALATTPAASTTTAAAPPANDSLDVVAPAPLKLLLERYLDLARVTSLANGDPIDDAEWQRLVDAAPAQVHTLLQTEGYFDPHVVLTQEAGAATGPAGGSAGTPRQRRVTLVLEPGPRTQVSRVTIDIEGALDVAAEAGDAGAAAAIAALRRSWTLPVGAPFRNPAWSDAKAAALARLRAAGYANANWNGTAAEVDAQSNGARLFLVVDSGPLFRFGTLQVEGLSAQDLQTVRDLANFDVGTPVSETLLLDYQDRLQKSGLFDSATVTLDADPQSAAAARINVRVREAALQVYTFGLGVSANTGPRASVEHVYRRVFGYAATARNKLEYGRLRQAWDGEISTHPGDGLYRNVLGGTVERLESSTDVVLSQRLHVGRTQDTQRVDRYYYVEAERSRQNTDTVDVDTLALSANYHVVFRKLDSVLLPTQGYSLSLQGNVGQSRGTNAETGPFSRLYARLTGYAPVGGSWFGQARIEFGQVVKKNTVAVPQSQLFRAGGDDSVRGYGYRALGPLVAGAVSGGDSLLTTSIELARPISAALPSLWGAVFIDAGNAADSFKALHPALGAGAGVRWRSPVGPLRLDVAYGREVRSFRIHFSVGVAF